MQRLLFSLAALLLLCAQARAIDIALCLDRIRPGADWGCAATYADLQRTWRDAVQTLPTQQDLDAAWAAIQAEQTPEAIAAAQKVAAKNGYDLAAPDGVLLRAVVATLLDEINVLRAAQVLQTVGVAQSAYNPPSLTNNTGNTSGNITVNGAAFGDAVLVTAPYSQAGVIVNAYVSAANTVNIRVFNASGGTLDLANGNWGVQVVRYVAAGLPARTAAQARTSVFSKVDNP